MATEFRRTGDWLFRRRSYLPLLLFGFVLLQMRHFEYFGGSHAWDRAWEFGCLSVSLLGLSIRVMTTGYRPHGTSGRNTHGQVAESLNTAGMYSITRHPLYLGNFFIWLGLALFTHTWWFTLVVSLIFWLYYERIMFAEEAFLCEMFGGAYLRWAQRTPAFLPMLRNWQPAGRPFSWRTVFRREYSALLAIIGAYTYLEVLGDFVVEKKLVLDGVWLGMFAAALVVYVTLRARKRSG